MRKEKTIQEKLTEKLRDQYNEFIDDIKKRTAKDKFFAIDRAYEIAYKQDILYGLEYAIKMDFINEEEMNLLFNIKGLLHVIYDEWLSMDADTTEWLADCIVKVAKYEAKKQ